MTQPQSMEKIALDIVRDAWKRAQPARDEHVKELEKQVKVLEELVKPITELLGFIDLFSSVKINFSKPEQDETVSFKRLKGTFTTTIKNREEIDKNGKPIYHYSVALNPHGKIEYRIGWSRDNKYMTMVRNPDNFNELAANVVDYIADDIGTYEWDAKEAEEKAMKVARLVDTFLAEQNLQPLEAAPIDTPDVTP